MNKRLIRVSWLFGCLFLIVIVRTAYVQLWDGPHSGTTLAEKALKYHIQIIPGEEYQRGEVLDCNLISLTDSGIKPTLVAFPLSITDIKNTTSALENIIGMEKEQLETIIRKNQEKYGERIPLIIKNNLTPQEVKKLEELTLPGLAVLPIKTRYGPKALAKHLIGYLNSIDAQQWSKLPKDNIPMAYKITDKIGVSGLEGKYEQYLRGSSPETTIQAIADGNGRILPGLGYKLQEEAADPWRNHLVLTIDKRYQEIVEQAMDKSIARGAVVVIDIPTGHILAAASRPNFQQNQIGKYITGVDELIDRTERIAFYPGSVFKMVVAAGVLEEGLATTKEIFSCEGTYQFSDGTEIKCLQEHNEVTLLEAICKSCNTTFVKLGLRLGNEKIAEYAAKLGFTINVDSTSPPALLGNASIGQQGVLVSPLQIANLYATIGRNGYYRPHQMINSIRNYQGDIVKEFPVKPPIQVLSKNTCSVLKKALVQAAQVGSGSTGWVDNGGTAGKTGTAQANNSNKVIAWFAGFTPVDEPRLAIAVMVEETEGGVTTGLTGGKNAAPVFKEIAEKIFLLQEREK